MKHFKISKILVGAGIAVALTTFSMQAHAQGTSTTDFEDAAKGNYNLGSVVVNGKSWQFSGVMIGSDTARDMRTGLKSARFRYVDSIPTSLTLEDAITDISSISFQYARSNFSGDRTGVSPKFTVQTGNGTTWTTLDTLDLAGMDELTTATYSTIPAGSSLVRFVAVSGDLGKRFNIDNITIDFEGTSSSSIALIYKTPFGTGVSTGTTQLIAKYSADIQKGTGDISLYKADGTLVETIDVLSTDVTIADSTATISGITLAEATSYYVLLDEGVFAKDGESSTTSNAVTSTTEWSFTTTSPTSTVTTLDETFTECSGATIGGFFQYSSVGAKKWNCTTFGNGDANAAAINGGSSATVSEENEDWLISSNKFDFSALSSPTLSFWNKKRYTGDVTAKIKVSTNYVGSGDPTLATWVDLFSMATPSGDNSWTQVSGISLTAHKSTPFHLAFIYECGTDGAYELTLDDIKVTNTTSIFENKNESKNLLVVGNPTSSSINVKFTTDKAGIYNADIIDLNGRVINAQKFNINNGINDLSFQHINLTAGMYVIKITNAAAGTISTVKAVVK